MKKRLIVLGTPLLLALGTFGQTPPETNFTFDGGPHMTSSVGCVDVLTQDGTTFAVSGTQQTSTIQNGGNQIILTGYTQPYSVTGFYLCFQDADYKNLPGTSLYLSSDPQQIAPGVWVAPLNVEGGAPLTYGDKTWGTRPDGTLMDGTQDGDKFVWTATTSFSDGSTLSLSLNYITDNTRFRHCRGGRGFTCWYTEGEFPYLQGGSGTYFFASPPA